MRIIVVVALALGARVAFADDGIRLDVEVGKTVERGVAIATGWFCDDPSLVQAEVVTHNNTNVWVVTGVKLGSTQCRVGTDPSRVHYVFDVHVIAKRR